jgi:hypothetical protein
MAIQRRPTEAINGAYSAIPHSVLDSTAFLGASYTAKALLFDLMRQHSGKNNGRFQLSCSWLKTRGWTSRSVIQRAKDELLTRNLIVRTRVGGLNMGAAQYAVTWLQISNFTGLDIQSKNYQRGAYALMNTLPPLKLKNPPPHVVQLVPLGGTVQSPLQVQQSPELYRREGL